MRQKLQEKGPSGSFIDRTNRSPAALTCGLNARVMSLSYANRGIEESGNGVTEEGAVVRAPDDGGALLVVERINAVVLDYVLPFSDDDAVYRCTTCGRDETSGGLDT